MDIISPSGDVTGLLVQSDMVEPIDTAKLIHFNEVDKKIAAVGCGERWTGLRGIVCMGS